MRTNHQKKKHSKQDAHPIREIGEGILAAIFVVLLGYIGMSHVFADRVIPHVRVGAFPVGGLHTEDVLQAMEAYEQEFLQTSVTIRFREKEVAYTMEQLGITLDKAKTAEKIRAYAGRKISSRRIQVAPAMIFHDETAVKALQDAFSDRMVIPQNPTLAIDAGGVVRILPGKNGEGVDMVSLNRDIQHALGAVPPRPVDVLAVKEAALLSQAEVEPIRAFAQGLLNSGFRMSVDDHTVHIPGSAVASMIEFTGQKHPVVQLKREPLQQYIAEHVAPVVNEDPVNARFKMEDGKVVQFSLPKDGRVLDEDGTIAAVQEALAQGRQEATIAMRTVRPTIADVGDSRKLGITSLLARGETDFVGSPKNRAANIAVGAAKYDGILIAPHEEFSFNKFLGPVTKEAGFLPELVIKNNATIAEYGGGLCQVSTTAFRAAVYSGMEITSRRNHSYAVRYYGTPGFDATIYPPYTDFRFLNNTPGYILIQTRIEGTKLSFEFWGTSDNRVVEVDGPHPYDRKPDGAVKAVLKQTVKKDGQTIIEDTFYSNYKSPDLFPHA